ncbi:MAG: serine/threonine-protein kinase PknK, partial [Leptospiraceae bacterium]|nr:serine/threonine-protein kinase PknK [Leptospiraceae bacterium]
MISISGYTIKEEIHSGIKSLVYRGEKSGKPVIIKVLRNEYPESSELKAFRYEFDIMEKLHSKGLIRFVTSEKYKNSLAIIMEDIGGESLNLELDKIQKSPLVEIVSLFIKTVTELGEIHKLNLVHKDIKPHNIILNSEKGEVRIIDFGNASFLTKQSSVTSLNSSLEGTLAYISPEQTGRMNRSVDYRTDFYSLGVTFYQLLTGEVPFVNTDPMELVHAHIAKIPTPVNKKTNCPKAISEIVMKLLNKSPEERYQSIRGILHDLEKCKLYLEEENLDLLNSESFVLAEKDYLGRFIIPEKLYGRENEISLITEKFQKAANGSLELMLISGRSGIGKSILINEVQKPITEYAGYFTTGKYDSFKRTIPYRAITQAFQSLVQQILSEPQHSIQVWKEKILEAIGVNGKIIIEFIPELESIIGSQPEVPELAPIEAQNRFNLVFLNFIKAFCKKEHPITIFLDDLQWADTASIQLLDTIFSDNEVNYLFLMLSFRDNEVFPTDPFLLLIERLKKENFSMQEINLNSLNLSNVNQLISDTLGTKPENSKPLAEIIYNKTKGNPFFVNNVFKDLYDKGLIFFENDIWNWEIAKINLIKISDNVIDLLVEKVKELPNNQIEILKLAACIGDWFRLDIFSQITSMPTEELNIEITNISNEGFFVINGNIVRFVHDKIREATYTLISEEEKAKNHYTTGNTYLRLAKKEEVDDLIFTIVNQLNQGLIFVIDSNEKEQIQKLNFLAGKKSLSSSAYEAALKFFTVAISLLEKTWETNYDQTLNLYTNKARAEYLSKDYANAETTFDLILSKAKDINDKIVIYELKSSMYVSQNKMIDSLNLLKQALQSLGVNLPKKPTELSPLPEILKFKFKMGKKTISDLSSLPLMKNEKSIGIMQLLNASLTPSFIVQP